MAEKDEAQISVMDLFHMAPSDMMVPIKVEIKMDAIYISTTAVKGSLEEADGLAFMKALRDDLCAKNIPHTTRERTVEGRGKTDCVVIKYEDMLKAEQAVA